MLRELSVQNLATIEDVRVEFEPGLVVWTGQTGAGKSLLLTALGLLLGGKASGELVRAGKQEARVSAVFELNDSETRSEIEAILGGPLEEPELILTRRVSVAGRGQSHANGMPVTTAMLRQIGSRLVEIHGQSEGRTLLEPETQRGLLDAYARLDAVVASYRAARFRYEELRRRRAELAEAAERRRRELQMLTFERDELATADVRAGEYQELARQSHRLAHAAEFRAATLAGYELLYEADGSVQELLEKVARRISAVGEGDAELTAVVQELERMAEQARELARQLRRYAGDVDDDPERLEEIESRLALYRKLAGRYRCDPDELPARLAEVEERLAALERDESDLAELDKPLGEAWAALRSAGEALSEGRRRAARRFAEAVSEPLAALQLDKARVSVAMETIRLSEEPSAAPPEHGLDTVEYVFAPNPGEPERPLRKIASGGELSRVALAVKTVLAEVDRVTTLVLDEADSGVGGRLGETIGRMLQRIARDRQVVCVTHLPQVASHADHHFVIAKSVVDGRTRTTIRRLDDRQRVAELAAMLRGDNAGESTRREARSMLSAARARR
ncbi:MAG: DNA repair protein RecN [Isosphaeraceae bacterium]|nr:MAG: DNA repair protein RecN [Isosphaeraceae bacterium]